MNKIIWPDNLTEKVYEHLVCYTFNYRSNFGFNGEEIARYMKSNEPAFYKQLENVVKNYYNFKVTKKCIQTKIFNTITYRLNKFYKMGVLSKRNYCFTLIKT